MIDRDKVDQCFERLAQCPMGLDMDNAEVLASLGLLCNAVLAVSSSNSAERLERTAAFCQTLLRCANPSHKASARRH